MLVFSIISITLALVFYTLGVWACKIQKILKPWHVLVFWLGLFCDILGTYLMYRLAGGILNFDLHGMTGIIAILLMLFQAIWATNVMVKNQVTIKRNFYKLSLLIWFIWLIPYMTGMFLAM
jgi:uncharacterized repeat protein (TIGR03987 family)